MYLVFRDHPKLKNVYDKNSKFILVMYTELALFGTVCTIVL